MEDRRLQRLWYVLHTKSRHESVVSDGLAKKSMEVFLPKVKVRSTRRDRKAMIHIPLFPGYLFIKTDLHPHTHLDIVKTAGVVRLIGTHQGPVPVADETVASLKIIATQNPVEFRGTYPLPEAQMDRFAMQLALGYLDPVEEVSLLREQSRPRTIAQEKISVAEVLS